MTDLGEEPEGEEAPLEEVEAPGEFVHPVQPEPHVDQTLAQRAGHGGAQHEEAHVEQGPLRPPLNRRRGVGVKEVDLQDRQRRPRGRRGGGAIMGGGARLL